MAISIPKSTFHRFTFDDTLGTRYGQQFYDYMGLEKITDPFNKLWCDQIYNASHHIARQMILTALDHDN